MSRTHRIPFVVAAFTIAIQASGCYQASSESPRRQAAGAARTASSFCAASSTQTVLEVSKNDTGDRKKVTNGCWWQFRVPPIHGYVNDLLGWQLCNACDVDIEFEVRNLPASALTWCSFDASNAAHETVLHGSMRNLGCTALQPTNGVQLYDTGARVAGTTGQFVDDDPELEIEDRGLLAYVARLAQTSGLTYCTTAGLNGSGTRLTISGQFERLNPDSSIVLVPTGSLFSAARGADLIEIAPRGAKIVAEGQKYSKFSVSIDLPGFVPQLALRDGGQKKTPLVLQQISACK